MAPFQPGQVANPSGRPKLAAKARRKPLSVRVLPHTLDWLKRAAQRQGASVGAIVDELVAKQRAS